MLNEVESRKQKLSTAQTEHEFLVIQSVLPAQSGVFIEKICSRFTSLDQNLDRIYQRIGYLSNILKVAQKIDKLQDKTLNMSAENFEALGRELEQIKLDAKQLSSGDFSQMPSVVCDKLAKVQEAYHHRCSTITTTTTTTLKPMQSSSLGGEKLSSSIEIKIINNQTISRIEQINQNTAQIECILSNKNIDLQTLTCLSKGGKKVSFSNDNLLNVSNHTERNTNMKLSDYSQYIGKLSKCKELIEQSKFVLRDVQTNDPNYDTRELKDRMKRIEYDIDLQIDRFEQNLARQAKIDKNLGKFNCFFDTIFALDARNC